MNSFFPSYVFLTEKPEHMGAFQRFYLLHELGHLSYFSKYTFLSSKIGGSPFFLLAIWVFPQINPSIYGLIVWIAYIFFIFFTGDFIYQKLQSFGKAFDEMAADRFALSNLKPNDVLEVADFYSSWPIPRDPSMEPSVDTVRRDVLARNLQKAEENRGRMEGFWMYSQRSATDLHVWFSFAFALTFAFISVTPSVAAASALVLVIVFGVPTTLLMLLARLWTDASSLARLIDRILSKPDESLKAVPSYWPAEPTFYRKMRRWFGTEAISCFKCYLIDAKGEVWRECTLAVDDAHAAIVAAKEKWNAAEMEQPGKTRSIQVWNNLLELANWDATDQ
jgi:hypothetical protein